MDTEKIAYICAPLTELTPEQQKKAKEFYVQIADVCQEVMGARAFVPHEHYDPVKHASFTPSDVDGAERRQVCNHTSVLIVVAIAPSWGGGIEVEMANRSKVPVVILCGRDNLENRRISRLLRGNPAVVATIPYSNEEEALGEIRKELSNLLKRGSITGR